MDTEIVVILDRSWSMNRAQAETISGFNEWLKTTAKGQKQGDDVRISVTIFDTHVDHTVVRVPLRACPKLGTDSNPYAPRGNTALLDAVGSTLTKAQRLVTKGKRGLAVIVTDGEENASDQWTSKKVGTLINKLTATDRWSFVYLGADIDAWANARSFAPGTLSGQTVSYPVAETAGAWSANAGVSRAYLGGQHTNSVSLGAETAAAMGQTVEAPPEPKPRPKTKTPKASS